MRILLEQLAILNLKGLIDPKLREYMTKEEAFELLREMCEIDFGENIDEWTEWVILKYDEDFLERYEKN